MTYSPDKKTLSLEPSLDLEWACFDVYTEINPSKLTEEKNEITGLQFKGYGVNELQIGNVKASFLETFGGTKLQRRSGEADWRLRASDYELSSDSELSYEGRSFVYDKTELRRRPLPGRRGRQPGSSRRYLLEKRRYRLVRN